MLNHVYCFWPLTVRLHAQTHTTPHHGANQRAVMAVFFSDSVRKGQHTAEQDILGSQGLIACRTFGMVTCPSKVWGGDYSVKIPILFGLRRGCLDIFGSIPRRCVVLTTTTRTGLLRRTSSDEIRDRHVSSAYRDMARPCRDLARASGSSPQKDILRYPSIS
jgi:hypothetical protein